MRFGAWVHSVEQAGSCGCPPSKCQATNDETAARAPLPALANNDHPSPPSLPSLPAAGPAQSSIQGDGQPRHELKQEMPGRFDEIMAGKVKMADAWKEARKIVGKGAWWVR